MNTNLNRRKSKESKKYTQLTFYPIQAILYNYCPYGSVIWRFVQRRQVKLPKGNTNCWGWTYSHITLIQGQQFFYYTELLQLQLHWQQWPHHRVILPTRVILQGNLIEYYPASEICLPKRCQRVILLVRVILQGNMTEYYPARDTLSTNESSNIAYEY